MGVYFNLLLNHKFFFECSLTTFFKFVHLIIYVIYYVWHIRLSGVPKGELWEQFTRRRNRDNDVSDDYDWFESLSCVKGSRVSGVSSTELACVEAFSVFSTLKGSDVSGEKWQILGVCSTDYVHCERSTLHVDKFFSSTLRA